jgi:hypothetical protein
MLRHSQRIAITAVVGPPFLGGVVQNIPSAIGATL